MIPHEARQYLFEVLRSLPPEEAERLGRLPLGARLRWALDRLRQHHPQLTIARLAREIGITRQALWSILQGRTERPSAPVITAICHTLGLPVSFVMLGLLPEDRAENVLPADLLRFALNPANAAYVRPALELALRCSELGLDPEAIGRFHDLLLAVNRRSARRG